MLALGSHDRARQGLSGVSGTPHEKSRFVKRQSQGSTRPLLLPLSPRWTPLEAIRATKMSEGAHRASRTDPAYIRDTLTNVDISVPRPRYQRLTGPVRFFERA